MKKILYSTTFTIQTSRKEASSILLNGYNALQILIITIIMTIVSLHYHYSKIRTFHDISANGSDFQKFNAIMMEAQLRHTEFWQFAKFLAL